MVRSAEKLVNCQLTYMKTNINRLTNRVSPLTPCWFLKSDSSTRAD